MNKIRKNSLNFLATENLRFSRVFKLIIFAFSFISVIGLANAFGYFRHDYDMLDFMGMSYFGLFAGFGLIVLAAIAFLFVFWLWMLIDCLKRDFKKDIEKIAWILVLIFLHILGTIVYYFVVKVNDKNKDGKKK